MISFPNSNFPAVVGFRWFNICVLVATPLIALYGLTAISRQRETVFFAIAYYVFSMLGITAGYHRLWSHRSYTAERPLQYFLLFGGTSAVQGSCLWWSKSHRSHHRFTDTDLDPYCAKRGFLWTHIGWMIVKTEHHSGRVDVSDLRGDPLLQWQHQHYFALMATWGFILPTIIPVLWSDFWGGLCFSACLRLTVAHHGTFCINSVAHYLGSQPYDDRLSPRDHLLSAIVTMGEGYHNFHHQFPMDYRNAYLWHQYDPTKWFIAVCNMIGLARHLRVFPDNEVRKGALSMKLKSLKKVQDDIEWPIAVRNLPVVSWETFQDQSKKRVLILVSGFIHDVTSFMDDHPGGAQLLRASSGKDMTPAFFGGVYSHSNAAHNLLSMKRVGILLGGVETVSEDAMPSSPKLYITSRTAGE
ncbi:delta 9-fatty acid desaturase protein [Fistulina hepatica ATCC 64428]|uniref:Acyl-CoA desaturase n=1 Tax=Fistulina hepatica ATCC 64428 TaxID=1128425 RepID=A0A0D7AK58_9AGAR|nr:delta 9-fatty acid desaturase protein [Fistulina hepatica ATCC 64428]